MKYWDRRNNTYINYTNSLSSSFITGIVRDNNNDIWLSTWAGGVNRINKKNNSVTQFSCYNPYTKQVEKNIWLVYKDSKANIWASATNEGSLYLFDRVQNNFVIFDKSVNNLQSFTETSDGKLWEEIILICFLLKKMHTKLPKRLSEIQFDVFTKTKTKISGSELRKAVCFCLTEKQIHLKDSQQMTDFRQILFYDYWRIKKEISG